MANAILAELLVDALVAWKRAARMTFISAAVATAAETALTADAPVEAHEHATLARQCAIDVANQADSVFTLYSQLQALFVAATFPWPVDLRAYGFEPTPAAKAYVDNVIAITGATIDSITLQAIAAAKAAVSHLGECVDAGTTPVDKALFDCM